MGARVDRTSRAAQQPAPCADKPLDAVAQPVDRAVERAGAAVIVGMRPLDATVLKNGEANRSVIDFD